LTETARRPRAAVDDRVAILERVARRRDLTTTERLASPPQRFMTLRTASGYSDLSVDSLRRLVESGKLTAHRPVRGRVLLDRMELDQVILGSTTHPRTGRGMVRPRQAAGEALAAAEMGRGPRRGPEDDRP